MDAIVAEGLAKRYPNGVWGVRCVGFRAGRARVVTLLGPNGAGKTTTIGILATLLKPSRGRALVLGYDVVSEAREVRRRVALMPQEGRPDMNWTPLEAVKWYLVARGFSLSAAEAQARLWLERLGLWEIRGRPGWELSGGQRKRVLAAMVLASGADVVFLDEPTEGLDVEARYAVWSAVRSALSEGVTVVYTTHDMREAERVSDRVVLVSRGVTVAEGRPVDLVARLPYRYRVVTSSSAKPSVEPAGERVVGSTRILYYRSEAEARSALAELGDGRVEPVGLEDVYLELAGGGGVEREGC